MAKKVLINRIVKDKRLQNRKDGLSKSHVEELAEALTEGAKLPPINAFEDDKGVYPYDGWHRIAAYESIKAKEIPAEIQKGTFEDAALLAPDSNQGHGLKRTNADKRWSVELKLLHPESKDWSDRRIAEAVGVSDRFVGEVRADQLRTVRSSNNQTQQNDIPEVRVGKDGKKRKVAKKKTKKTENTTTPPSDVSSKTSTLEPTTNGVHVESETVPDEDEITKTLRSLNARLLTKEREIKALAEELSKFSVTAKYPKLRTAGGLIASLDTAARSCRAVAFACRDAVSVGECTGCKGKGGACKDCSGDGFMSVEEQRNAHNRKAAGAPRAAV